MQGLIKGRTKYACLAQGQERTIAGGRRHEQDSRDSLWNSKQPRRGAICYRRVQPCDVCEPGGVVCMLSLRDFVYISSVHTGLRPVLGICRPFGTVHTGLRPVLGICRPFGTVHTGLHLC